MKTLKKSLIALLIVAVTLSLAAVIAVAVSPTQSGTLAEVNALIEQVKAAPTAKEKATKLSAVSSYISSHAFPDAESEKVRDNFEKISSEVSDFTINEADTRLAAVVRMTKAIDARVELNAIRALINGEGYIAPTAGVSGRLNDDIAVADACVDLMYIGLDEVDLIERGEVLLEFMNKIKKNPLNTASAYYSLYEEKKNAVVDKTVGLLYDELNAKLAVAENAEKTVDERLAAVADFRALCARCYFDTARPEYKTLVDRCTVADGRIYLVKIAAMEALYDKGKLLKDACRALENSGLINNGAADSDKTKFFAEHETVKKEVSDLLYAEATRLLHLAAAEDTADRPAALAEYDKYLADCYFDAADSRYGALIAEKTAADAMVLLYAVTDKTDVVEQNKALKTLIVFLNKSTLNTATGLGKVFNDRYSGTAGVYEIVMSAFYNHMETLTHTLGDDTVDFNRAREAKETILALVADGYFESGTDRQKAFTTALSASERGFGGRAIDWANAELRAAMAMTDVAGKKTRIENTKTSFGSYGVKKYASPSTNDEIAFNDKYDTYIDTLFYAELDVLTDDLIAANDAGKDLSSYFDAINEHLATYSYDSESEDFAAYTAKVAPVKKAYGKKNLDEANALCAAAEEKTGSDLLSAFQRVDKFHRTHEFYEDEEYLAFLTRLAALSERADAVLAELKAKLDENVPLSEYNDTSVTTLTFENGAISGTNTTAKNRVFIDMENGGCNSEKCMTIVYKEQKDTYYTWAVKDAAKTTVVLEFDVTSFGTIPSVLNFGSGANSTSKNRVYPTFFRFVTVGGQTDLYTKGGGQVLKKDILQPGVWTHIAMTYNPVTKMIQMYVNYEKAGEPYQEGGTGCTDWDWTEGLRLGSNNSSGTVSFDNLTTYVGTAPRTVDRFKDMSAEDKFLTFGTYLEKYQQNPEAMRITDVNYSYSQMSSLLQKYWSTITNSYITDDPDLRHMVDIYRTTDKESIRKAMGVITLNGLKELYDHLMSINSGTAYVNDKASAMGKIDKYIELNSDTLDITTDEYKKLMADIDVQRVAIELGARVKKFADAIQRFELAPSLAAMTRHYENCASIYGDGFDLDTLSAYPDLPDLIRKFQNLRTTLQTKTKEANSKSIVECMGYVAKYDREEYEEKYEEINKYIVIVRNLVTPNEDGSLKYQVGYLGLSSALRLYEEVNGFFFERLQLEHIAKLSAELNKYTTLDSYIEKLGVCIFIRNYVATNAVDQDNAEIRRIIESCAVFEEELGLKDGKEDPDRPNYQLEKYKKLIEQNTVYFVDTVNRMVFIDGYADLKKTYDDVMKIYYYMNIDSAEVQAAQKEFAKYENILREMETHSELFIKAMAAYAEAQTPTEKYKALSAAYGELFLGANAQYDGISDAMATYKDAAAAYNAKADTVNAELASTVTVMCSARVEYDAVKYVVAAFRKRYE